MDPEGGVVIVKGYSRFERLWYFKVKPKLVFSLDKQLVIADHRLAIVNFFLTICVVVYLCISLLARASFLTVEAPKLLLSSYTSSGQVEEAQTNMWGLLQTEEGNVSSNFCVPNSDYDYYYNADTQYIYDGCLALDPFLLASKGKHTDSWFNTLRVPAVTLGLYDWGEWDDPLALSVVCGVTLWPCQG
ncbi:hypothetical protein CYMTET_31167, partial [Cymbomonas tetramitiformis]